MFKIKIYHGVYIAKRVLLVVVTGILTTQMANLYVMATMFLIQIIAILIIELL
jgi:hypothetical protein